MEKKSIKERDNIVPFLLFMMESDKILSIWGVNVLPQDIGFDFVPTKIKKKEHTNGQRF